MGAGGSAGINFIRALRLSKQPMHIVGVETNKYYLELSPVDVRYWVPHPRGEEKKYARKIADIVKKERIDFIHAQPDPEVKILSDYRNEIRAKTFLPNKQTVDLCQDKWTSYVRWVDRGIPVAYTERVTSIEQLKKFFLRKKKQYWLRLNRGAGGKGSLPVSSFEESSMWIQYWSRRGISTSDFLISDILPGKEISWVSIWKAGKLICSQQKERYEWVQSGIAASGVGGTTAIQRTVSNPVINRLTTRAVLAVEEKPNGIFVVDAKQDESGKFCVTEINPGRFFTTTLFFATAGVNFPELYLRLGIGEPIPAVKQYNNLERNIFWIRVPDGGPVMIRHNEWTSVRV